MFVPGKPFRPSLRFAGMAGAYPSKAPFICFTLGWAPCLNTNIRLGWKGLPGTNTLAYYENSSITAVKGFITLAPGSRSPAS